MPAAAVLFDSGGVILRPIGGRWNPRFDFEDVVRRHHPVTGEELRAAITAGDVFLDESPADVPRREYHRHLLRVLGVTEPSDEVLDELDRPLPFSQVVEVFPDARPTLERLRRHGVRMALVSDAGPELERAYSELGLAEYFEAFAISAVVGVTKPDPRMFERARSALAVDAADCLVVDDVPELVAAAIDLGHQAVWLRRTPERRRAAVPTIGSLDELVPLAVG